MSNNSKACLPPLRPFLAKMNPGPYIKSKRKVKPVYSLKQSNASTTPTEEPSPPRSQSSGFESEKEVHISQCSLEYDSEKEVHFPAKNVVARVLSPEPRERSESFDSNKQRAGATTSLQSKSPTPSYRTVDSSQDPEVVPADRLFPPIDEEPEEMIHQGDEQGDENDEEDDDEDELTSDAESDDDIHLPLQDFDGRDIVPQGARLHRPPSWDYGVPLWPLVTNSSVASGVGTSFNYIDPVSPMSPAQEKPAFNFPPPPTATTVDSLAVKALPPVKRNSWRAVPDYEGTSWI